MYHIGFIIEQALGHITHTRNLQQVIPCDPQVCPHWGLLPFDAQGLAARIPVYRSNWTVRAGLRARQALSTLTQQQQLDVLFFHTQVPATFTLDWIRRIPSVISLDATPLQYDQLGTFYNHQQGQHWAELLKWRLSRAVFDTARHLVTWSEWARQSLIRDYAIPPQKVTVIPPGVIVSAWQRPQPRLRHQGLVKLLFVGSNFERKGGPLLLEAFRQLRPAGVELHIVTRDPLPAEPGLFVYAPMQPNSPALQQLYFDCDIFALPTYGDTSAMVLAEASAAGMAVVSTRLAGIAEVVLDGQTGILVPVGDGAAFSDALNRLIHQPDLRLSLGERAVRHMAQSFDSRLNTLRLLALLKGLAAPGA